ncbi:transcriptional activator DEMETER-like [Canna indica]|uniref:Transcriptional activator DEMETER-like n=1 Tax=Canna indica TaxID=4628 RepID=A0AAQ3JX02_9LILI|nr:transcriptional activator DEMETER-like [Canna indica]
MRGECKHFASAFASSRLKLTGPEEKNLVSSKVFAASEENHVPLLNPTQHIYQLEGTSNLTGSASDNCQPIIEEPASPEAECIQIEEREIEDAFYEDPDEIPTIKLNIEEFTQNLQNYMQSNNMEIQDVHMSKALVAINPEAASIPMPKLKNVSRLRTEHLVYELPDSHPLLEGFDPREPDDPSSYLLAIWTPGETAQSTETSKESCQFQDTGAFCNKVTCFSCNSRREAQAQIVRGTILIPCRTAMGGSFPLNGTYFQVNEVFADHDSSRNPIDVPREWIWNLSRRMVYFGTSVTSIFRGLNTEEIQFCFWRGFVCVRGFDRKTRAPRPLYARLHLPASKVPKNKQREKDRPAKRTPNNTRQKDNI